MICGLYRSPIGSLSVTLQDDCLSRIDWTDIPEKREITYRILDAYFESRPLHTTIPVILDVTSFQNRVLDALLRIPFGQVRTYGELAADLDTSSRAIGQACRTNPVSIIIPCHRVVAANNIGGFMGKQQKTDIKRWLLQHEGIF